MIPSGDKKYKTNIVEIVTKFPLDMTVKIEPFPLPLLDSLLVLEAPKKVIQYVPSASSLATTSSTTPIPAVDNKTKPAKQKIVRGPKVIKPKRSQVEAASIYAEEEKSAFKRGKLADDVDDEYGPEVVDDSFYGGRLGDASLVSPQVVKKRLPTNFDKVAGDLFDEFWNLEFEDHEITWAFFAKITSLNCKDYKLQNFADTSYCLAVIKDKLKTHSYFSTEDFVFDFHQMFANVLKYYDELHPAYRKAIELQQQFETGWAQALTKFIW